MAEQVIFLSAVLFAAFAAVMGDRCTPSLRPGKSYVHTNWAGATTGALAGILLLNCVCPFSLLIDPTYVLVQELLFAGILGAVVDIPMMTYRNYHAKVPARRTAWEVAALVVLAGLFVVGLVVFRENYQPKQWMVGT